MPPSPHCPIAVVAPIERSTAHSAAGAPRSSAVVAPVSRPAVLAGRLTREHPKSAALLAAVVPWFRTCAALQLDGCGLFLRELHPEHPSSPVLLQ